MVTLTLRTHAKLDCLTVLKNTFQTLNIQKNEFNLKIKF